MKLKTFAAALLIGASSTAALAADLPSRRVAPAPALVSVAPIFTWTGFYAGLQAGYAWDKISFTNAFVVPGVYNTVSFNRGGFVGGGHIGYLVQMNPIVLGLEADLEGSTISGSGLRGSVRGRAGLAFDRTLAYVTGGLAIANQGYGWSNYYGYNNSTTRLGWTAGAGLEYAISQNWSARAEYRYSDFGKTSNNFLVASSVGRTEHAVRLGVSYHFSTGYAGPVVARY